MIRERTPQIVLRTSTMRASPGLADFVERLSRRRLLMDAMSAPSWHDIIGNKRKHTRVVHFSEDVETNEFPKTESKEDVWFDLTELEASVAEDVKIVFASEELPPNVDRRGLEHYMAGPEVHKKELHSYIESVLGYFDELSGKSADSQSEGVANFSLAATAPYSYIARLFADGDEAEARDIYAEDGELPESMQ